MAAGSISKRVRPNGAVRYRAIVDLGPDPITGKRRQRYKDCITRRAAQIALAALKREVDQGTAVDRSPQTVTDVLAYWLESYAQFKAPRTYEGYRYTIRTYVEPYLGRIKVQDLRPTQVQSWMTSLRGSGKGQRTVELAHLRLCQALDQAVKLGVVARNAARSATVAQTEEKGKEMVTWTAEQARTFLEVATREGIYGPIWLVSLATGMRRGELLGLRWADVDVEHEVLRVRQSVGLLKGAGVIGDLKSCSAQRDIPVEPEVIAALEGHREGQNKQKASLGDAYQDHGLVFASAVGTPINPNNLLRDYYSLLIAAGVPRIRIHDQRHTHVTWAMEEGGDLKTVSLRVGHSETGITADLYQHVSDKMSREVSRKIGRKLFGKDT